MSKLIMKMNIICAWNYIVVIILFSSVAVHSDSYNYQRFPNSGVSTNRRTSPVLGSGNSFGTQRRPVGLQRPPARGRSIQVRSRLTNLGAQRINFRPGTLIQNRGTFQNLGKPRINAKGGIPSQIRARQSGLLQRNDRLGSISTYVRDRPQELQISGTNNRGRNFGGKSIQPALRPPYIDLRNNQGINLRQSTSSINQKIPFTALPSSKAWSNNAQHYNNNYQAHNINLAPIPARSLQTNFKPPIGYKIKYCKIYNKTHQLVTLAPITPQAVHIPQYIRNIGISRSSYANYRVTHNVPTKYMMVRAEDYVICSRPYISPTRQPNLPQFTKSWGPYFKPNTHFTTSIPLFHTYFNQAAKSPILKPQIIPNTNFKSSTPIRSFPKPNNNPKSGYNYNIRRPGPIRSSSQRFSFLRPNRRFPKFPLPNRRNNRNRKTQYSYRRRISNTRIALNKNNQPYRRILRLQKPLPLPRRLPFTKLSSLPLKLSTPAISGILSNIFRTLPSLIKVPNFHPQMYRPPIQHQSTSLQKSRQNQGTSRNQGQPQKPSQEQEYQKPQPNTQVTTSSTNSPTVKMENLATHTQTTKPMTTRSPPSTAHPTPRAPPRRVPPFRRVRKERIRLIIPQRFKEEIEHNAAERERILEIAEEEERERKKRSLIEKLLFINKGS